MARQSAAVPCARLDENCDACCINSMVRCQRDEARRLRVRSLVIFKFNPLHANAVKMNAQVAQSDANASSGNKFILRMHAWDLLGDGN